MLLLSPCSANAVRYVRSKVILILSLLLLLLTFFIVVVNTDSNFVAAVVVDHLFAATTNCSSVISADWFAAVKLSVHIYECVCVLATCLLVCVCLLLPPPSKGSRIACSIHTSTPSHRPTPTPLSIAAAPSSVCQLSLARLRWWTHWFDFELLSAHSSPAGVTTKSYTWRCSAQFNGTRWKVCLDFHLSIYFLHFSVFILACTDYIKFVTKFVNPRKLWRPYKINICTSM